MGVDGARAASNQEILDSWSDQVYSKYENMDVDGMLTGIKNTRGQNPTRYMTDQALMYLYYYYRRCEPMTAACDETDLAKTKKIVTAVIDNYENNQGQPMWGRGSLTTVPMNMLSYTLWWGWKEWDETIKSKFFHILEKEADFWTWVGGEIIFDPTGKTIPGGAGRFTSRGGETVVDTNLSLLTPDPQSNGYLKDTRAEEIGAIAQFLATAGVMDSANPKSKGWLAMGRFFAFHTLSRGEKLGDYSDEAALCNEIKQLFPGKIGDPCAVISRNIGDDWVVGNHNLFPSPMYALAGMTSLTQGQLSYKLVNWPIPSEFKHGIEQGTDSPFWQKNETDCGCSVAGGFTFNTYCHKGLDWGDNLFLAAPIVVGYWEKIGENATITSQAVTLQSQMLLSLQQATGGKIWSKVSTIDTSAPLSSYPIYWWKDLEIHPQIAAKYWVISNFSDVSFRRQYFPNMVKNINTFGDWFKAWVNNRATLGDLKTLISNF